MNELIEIYESRIQELIRIREKYSKGSGVWQTYNEAVLANIRALKRHIEIRESLREPAPVVYSDDEWE